MTFIRTATMHTSDMTIQPTPWAMPKTNSAPCSPGTSQTVSNVT